MRGYGAIVFLLFLFSNADAQIPNPLFERLCKSWGIVKLEDNGHVQKSDEAQADYRLVFNKDSTVLQGLAPDGFIAGTWKIDEKKMIITISDKRTDSSYRLKIIKISNEELILQNLDESKSLVIYYKAV
jgi:hypothetical protein